MDNIAFLAAFDLLTPQDDWTGVSKNPGFKVTSNGYAKGSQSDLKRFVKLRVEGMDEYDKIVATVKFKEGEDWVDVPNYNIKLHRRGAVWSICKGQFMEVTVYFGGERRSVYSLIEETFRHPTEAICYDQYLSLKNRYSPRLTFEKLLGPV